MTIQANRVMLGLEMKEFHDHLDECKWCKDHVFDLCEIGEELLIKAGNAVQNY